MDNLLFDQLAACFDAARWKYEASTDRSTICLVFQGHAGPWNTFVRTYEDDQQVAAYGVLPFTIEPERRAAAAELITRINFGLVIGNFEMDFNDGEIRFRTSIDLEDDRLSDALLLHLVRANLTMMDTYIPAFVAFVASEITAGDALAMVE